MSTIGENIATLRKRNNLTQEELALKVGYNSKSSINKIELGINDLPQNKIICYAEVFGVTPAELMGWDLEEIPSKESELTEIEKELLALFRNESEENKRLMLDMLTLISKKVYNMQDEKL